MGECNNRAVDRSLRVPVDTFAGRIHVEWDPDAAVTPLGQLPFIEFLKDQPQCENWQGFSKSCPVLRSSWVLRNSED